MSKAKTVINAASGEVESVNLSVDEQSSIDSISTESAIINARANRDMLLAASDWRVVADAPWDTTAWATYRQALRDLPADPAYPNVEFPDPPEVN
jgi:hypothetical protein